MDRTVARNKDKSGQEFPSVRLRSMIFSVEKKCVCQWVHMKKLGNGVDRNGGGGLNNYGKVHRELPGIFDYPRSA